MLFFGILFATSWIGSILSLGESLPANAIAKFSSEKVSSLGRFAIKSRSLLVSTKQSARSLHVTMNATILPSRFFNIDWGTKESKTIKTQIPSPASRGVKARSNQLCSAVEGIFNEPIPVKNMGILPLAKVIEATASDRDFLPNRILLKLRSGLPPTLQNFSVSPISSNRVLTP